MITVVGAHAEGDVGRVITGGFNPPRADTMFERMQVMERDHDWLRRLMLSDPRGSVNCAVNLLMPAIRPDADIGMIVMEPDFYVPMSGGNLICTVTVALETGFIPMTEPQTVVRVDTPAGLVEAVAKCSGGKCRRVTFRNVASFVMHRDAAVEVEGLGTLRADLAYGGMIYCIVDSDALGLCLARDEARDLVNLGERIRAAAAEQLPSVHPENPGIHTINQTLFAGPMRVENGVKRSKNTVVVSPGRLAAALAEPEPRRGWHCCTHAANWPRASCSSTNPSSTPSSTVVSPARRISAAFKVSSPKCRAAHG